MTRILFLVVDDLDPSEDQLARMASDMESRASGPVTVTAKPIEFGLGHYYESFVGLAMATPGVLHQVDAHQHDADAIILGCFGDPGLHAAREISQIPVIGPGEASMLHARRRGSRFGIIHIRESNIAPCETQIASLGLTEQCVGMGAIDLAFNEVMDDVEHTLQLLVNESERLARAGAETIVIGCLSLSPLADVLSRRLGLPVVDPARAAVEAAEEQCKAPAPPGFRLDEPEHLRSYLRMLVRLSDAEGLRAWRAIPAADEGGGEDVARRGAREEWKDPLARPGHGRRAATSPSPLRFLEQMTWPEVKEAADRDLPVVLAIGACEQHGPHLPLSTDAILPVAVAEAASTLVPLIVAPPIAYGAYSRPLVGGGERFPGTISLSATTLLPLVKDVVCGLAKSGFRQIVALNWHLENAGCLWEACERATREYPETRCVLIENPFPEFTSDELKQIFPHGFAGWALEHASIVETSMMLKVRPDLVRIERVVDDAPRRAPDWDVLPPPTDFLTTTGVLARATGASADIGELLLTAAAQKLAAAIQAEFHLSRAAAVSAAPANNGRPTARV
jgi:creatinine amidohydrolase